MAKIYSPNAKYNGETASVKFNNGVGETDNKYLIQYLKDKGYKIEENIESNVDIELEELKNEATKLGIKFNNKIGKDKLKERIEEKKKIDLPEDDEIPEENIEDDEIPEDFFEDPKSDENI